MWSLIGTRDPYDMCMKFYSQNADLVGGDSTKFLVSASHNSVVVTMLIRRYKFEIHTAQQMLQVKQISFSHLSFSCNADISASSFSIMGWVLIVSRV